MGTSAAKPGELRYGDHIVVSMAGGTYVPAIFLKEQLRNCNEFPGHEALVYRPAASYKVGWVDLSRCRLSVLDAVARTRRMVWPDPNVGPEFRFSGRIRLPRELLHEGSPFATFHQIFDIKDRVRVPGCRITNWYYAESTFEFSDKCSTPDLTSRSWISEKRLDYKLDWNEGFMMRLAKSR